MLGSTGERGSFRHPALHRVNMVTNTHEWLMRDAREGVEHESTKNCLSKKIVENVAIQHVLHLNKIFIDYKIVTF